MFNKLLYTVLNPLISLIQSYTSTVLYSYVKLITFIFHTLIKLKTINLQNLCVNVQYVNSEACIEMKRNTVIGS